MHAWFRFSCRQILFSFLSGSHCRYRVRSSRISCSNLKLAALQRKPAKCYHQLTELTEEKITKLGKFTRDDKITNCTRTKHSDLQTHPSRFPWMSLPSPLPFSYSEP